MSFYFLNYSTRIKHEVKFFTSIAVSQHQNALCLMGDDKYKYKPSRLIDKAYMFILTIFLIYIVIKC